MNGKLSRREFIRTAGLMGTGLTLATCTPVAPQVSTGDDRQAAMEPVVANIFDYDPNGNCSY